jgi:myo-inositol-1(or 4)-monophosphatase
VIGSAPPVVAACAAELARYAAFARQAAAEAGRAILPHFRVALDVADKAAGRGAYDPVTEADRAAETVIRAAIARAYPGHGILGEEHGRAAGSEAWTWVIDPIDGTRSFILGQLHWATLIALNDGARPVVGVAHQPFVGETFVGIAGGAATWHRGAEQRVLRTRSCASMAQAVVASTDPRHFASARQQATYAIATDAARLVRFGGDCYCYTQLAMGLVDIVIETGLQPYDIQALMPLIQSAGGVVTSWTGGDCSGGGDVLACGDPRLHAALLERMRSL